MIRTAIRMTGGSLLATMLILALTGPAFPQSAPDSLETLREESLRLVNEARTERGLEPLARRPALDEAAQAHAEDMLERDFYAHVSPEGETVMDRFRRAGGSDSEIVAENIAECRNCDVPADATTVESLHGGWMNSPEHRENILAEGLTGYGFGIAEHASGTRYSVQTFAGPGISLGAEAEESGEALDPSAQSVVAASLLSAQRDKTDARQVSADATLIEAARNIIPAGDLSEVSLDELNSLQDALPADAPWRSVQMIAGSCGGCGVEATEADVRFFIGDWLEQPQNRSALLDPSFSALGLVIKADGRGRKIAVAILGAQ